MIFTKLGENEIRCVLSEEEFVSFGIDLDDILEKNVKSGRFFNEILSQAIVALGETDPWEIRGCSAQINVLKDRSISILFHTRKDKDLSEFARKLFEAGESLKQAADIISSATDRNSLLVSFNSLEDVSAYCKAEKAAGHIVSRLFKNRKSGEYILFMLRYACDDAAFNRLKLKALEYGRVSADVTAFKVYIMENSEMLIEEDAFYSLGEL